MENQPYNSYGTVLHEGSSRRSQSFNQHGSSIEHSNDPAISNNCGNITAPSSYLKGVSYDGTNQNLNPYLYDNSSREPNNSMRRKETFVTPRDRASNNHKSYPNDTDDELAYASASLAYRREELEARLRGHSTIDSIGSSSIRNRRSDVLDLAGTNFTPTSSEVLLSRDPSLGRNSLEVPSFNTAPPLKRQYSTDARWNGGNRFVQQRSWDLHNSQTLVSHDPSGLAPPTMNRGLSRSFDDSCINQVRNDKSPLSTRKRAVLERGVTYHGDDPAEYQQDCAAPSTAGHVGGKNTQYESYGVNKGSTVEHQSSYGNETIVRDFKPGYRNMINGSGTNGINFPYTDQSSVRNHQFQQKLGSQDGYHHSNTTDHRLVNVRQSEKLYGNNNAYHEGSKHVQGVTNDDSFIEPADYRHLLNPQNEDHTPGVYRKSSKNGSIQWWKDQLSNSHLPYKDPSGYGYTHPDDQRGSNNRNMQTGFKDDQMYPLNRNPNLPDVTVNVTDSEHDYNALSGNKSFWCKFNPLGSKGGRNQYNSTLQAPSINGHMINNTDNTKMNSYDQQSPRLGFGGRQEDMGGHYNNNLQHFNDHMVSNNNIENGISVGNGQNYNLNENERRQGMNKQMNYQPMNEGINNHNSSYVGFSTILDHQRQKGFKVSSIYYKCINCINNTLLITHLLCQPL